MIAAALLRRSVRTVGGPPPTPPPGDYSSTYRFCRNRDPACPVQMPNVYNAAGAVIGNVETSYDVATGRYTADVFPLGSPSVSDVGGIIGTIGSDDSTITANTVALQAAIDARGSTGGRIRVLRGCTFNRIVFPNQATRQTAREWIVLEAVDSGGGSMSRPYGKRVQVTDYAQCATVRNRFQIDGNGDGSFYMTPGVQFVGGASFIRITGLRGVLTGTYAGTNGVTQNLGFFATTVADGSGVLSNNSEWIILDRCAVDGRSTPQGLKRAASLFGKFMGRVGCRWDEIGAPADVTDAQCVRIGNLGPYIDKNSYFSCEVASQCWVTGGYNVGVAANVPVDIQVTDCFFTTSQQRIASGAAIPKTLLESKYHDRLWIEGNYFTAGRLTQFGYAVNIKLAANGSTPAEIRSENTTIRCNRTDGTIPLLGILGRDGDAGGSPFPTRLVVVEQNYDPRPADPAAVLAIHGGTLHSGARVDLRDSIWMHHNWIVGPVTSSSSAAALPFVRSGGSPPDNIHTNYYNEANLYICPPERPDGFREAYVGMNQPADVGFFFSKAAWDAVDVASGASAVWRRNGAVSGPGARVNSAWVINFGTADVDIVATDFAAAQLNSDGTLGVSSPFRSVDYDGGNLGADGAWVIAQCAPSLTGE
jgi:hypothetical protein